MGWTDVAQKAMDKALDAYKEVIEVKATVNTYAALIEDFRKEQRGRQADYEKRVDDKVDRVEKRLGDRLDSFDKRLLALETKVAEVQGTIAATMGKAFDLILATEIQKRAAAQLTEPPTGNSHGALPPDPTNKA